ncbi:MAG TPA: DUF1294 domain-containing protein [Clostridia bacterium]|nr:DUF1294 domain-containing protein [Clostridia bacterium]
MGNETLLPVVAACMIAMSAVLFAVMGADKRRAQTGGRRVRERTLFLLALLGGALGGVAGMRVFRHKTKHASFVIGMPLLLILNLAAAFLILYLNGK